MPSGRQTPCPFAEPRAPFGDVFSPGAPFGDVFPPLGVEVASSGAGELLPAGPSHEHRKGG